MSIITPRYTYKPFEYPQFYEYWLLSQQSHWLHTEINLSGDIINWKVDLTDGERNVIGFILKGFTQTEVFVQEYWSQKVARWFPKVEIAMMCSAFASFESIHSVSYNYLSESLGLQDFDFFMHEPSVKARIDVLVNTKGKTKEDILKSLIIFSCFTEGISLYSSFGILLSMSRNNLLKGLGSIISFSLKDESMHSSAGINIANIFKQEFPEIWTKEIQDEIYDICRLVVKLEDDFLDKAFEKGDIRGITKHDIKNFIRFRANTKLNDIGLKKLWKNIDKEAMHRMEWFSVLTAGISSSDFFANRVTDYSKGSINFNNINFDLNKNNINGDINE